MDMASASEARYGEGPHGNSPRLGARDFRSHVSGGDVASNDLRPTQGMTKHGLQIRPSPIPKHKERIRPGGLAGRGTQTPIVSTRPPTPVRPRKATEKLLRRAGMKSSAAAGKLSGAEQAGIAFVNALFSIPPVRSTLAAAARMVMADNARRFGVDWRASASKWRSRLAELKEELHLLDAKPNYPKYYR